MIGSQGLGPKANSNDLILVLVLRQGHKVGYLGCIPMHGNKDFPNLVSQPQYPTLGPNISNGQNEGSQDRFPNRVVILPSQDWASRNVTVRFPLNYLLYPFYFSQLPSPKEGLVF